MNELEILKQERTELSQRISALSLFIHVSPEYKELSGYCKKLMSLQLEFMNGYSLLLDLRINEIESKGDTVDVQPIIHGKWINEEYDSHFIEFSAVCSVCGYVSTDTHLISEYHKYCENCGARMDGDTP